MSDKETRFTAHVVEVRAAGDSRLIGGYAAKFGTVSQDLGGFVETIAPTFFNRSRGRGWPDVMARWNHDDNQLIGTTAAGTLRLTIDDIGLVYEVDMPNAREDLLELVQRGDVRRSSFAFRTVEDEWGQSEQGMPLRTLLEGQLVDVAPVNSPAYVDTTVAMRSLATHVGASVEEVRAAADVHELRKFFRRTGEGPRRESGAVALMKLKAMENTAD